MQDYNLVYMIHIFNPHIPLDTKNTLDFIKKNIVKMLNFTIYILIYLILLHIVKIWNSSF